MDRIEFIKTFSLAALTPFVMKLSGLKNLVDGFPASEKMPVLFIGHGNPMNAIDDNKFSRAWKKIALSVPKPKAILCISAHWLTKGTFVTAMQQPKTIYDFYGFPDELYKVNYNCPGSPELAGITAGIVKKTEVKEDHEWGLDHGTWSILYQMYPKADIPVFQLSIDYGKPASFHYELGKELALLREKGVLIIGSGNIVHNLGMASFASDPKPYDWAVEFDEKIKQLLIKGEHHSVVAYEKLGKAAQLSVPTPDHYYPLLYTIALQQEKEQLLFPVEGMAFASGSMRSVRIG